MVVLPINTLQKLLDQLHQSLKLHRKAGYRNQKRDVHDCVLRERFLVTWMVMASPGVASKSAGPFLFTHLVEQNITHLKTDVISRLTRRKERISLAEHFNSPKLLFNEDTRYKSIPLYDNATYTVI